MQIYEIPDDNFCYFGWFCPSCGQTWTAEQIDLAYFLMGISESEGKSDE